MQTRRSPPPCWRSPSRRRCSCFAPSSRPARERRQRAHLPQHRAVPHRRLGHRGRRAGDAGARSPLHDLRGHPQRRPLEDHQRRHDVDRRFPTASAPPPSAPSRIAPSNSQHRLDGHRRPGQCALARTPARASSSRPTPARRWQFMGLPDSHHIARIVIHPTNPDIVYVAAMGHLFSQERGARRVPDDRRRQVLEEGALRQRRRRRDRSRHQPQDAGDPLRGDVRQGSPAVADHRERT